jgi:hypothetical protein
MDADDGSELHADSQATTGCAMRSFLQRILKRTIHFLQNRTTLFALDTELLPKTIKTIVF